MRTRANYFPSMIPSFSISSQGHCSTQKLVLVVTKILAPLQETQPRHNKDRENQESFA